MLLPAAGGGELNSEYGGQGGRGRGRGRGRGKFESSGGRMLLPAAGDWSATRAERGGGFSSKGSVTELNAVLERHTRAGTVAMPTNLVRRAGEVASQSEQLEQRAGELGGAMAHTCSEWSGLSC